MIKVSTTGMAVSLKTDLRFPISGQWGHGDRIIQFRSGFAEVFLKKVAKNFKYVYTRQVLQINEH